MRRAATEMVLARLVEASIDRPARFSVDTAAWARLLFLRRPLELELVREGSVGQDLPRWRFWAQVFAFLANSLDVIEGADTAGTSSIVRASALRDVAETFRRPLAWNGIEWIDPRLFPGERYQEAFGILVASVCDLVGRNA